MEGLGLIARSDHRGLHTQTEIYRRYLKPERVLVMDMGENTPYKQHFDKYADPIIAKFPLREPDYIRFAKGLRWVFTCETFYLDDAPEITRKLGGKSAVQFNHEFCRWTQEPNLSRPDLFIAPSTWALHRFPFPYVYLPTPIPRDQFPFDMKTHAKTFLHVAGHAAAYDRAGTRTVLEALRFVQTPIEFVIRSQSSLGLSPDQMIGKVHLRYIHSDVARPEELYMGCDVLVSPRRYGGQSLPYGEAASMGMPVIALNREPEKSILDSRSLVKSFTMGQFTSQGGPIHLYNCNAQDLAAKIDELANDPGLVKELSIKSDIYAQSLDWANIGSLWVSMFA